MSPYRDFTAIAREEIYRLIDEASIREGNWWSSFIDLISDTRLKRYLNYNLIYELDMDIAKYHEFILSIKNTTKSEIDQIWEEVYRCEHEHVVRIRELKDRIREVTREFSLLADVMDSNYPGGRPIEGSTKALSFLFHESINTEREYDLYLQQQLEKLMNDERFSQESWNRCKTTAEREALLNEFFAEVQKIMGIELDITEIQFIKQKEGVGGTFSAREITGKSHIEIDPDWLMTGSREALLTGVIHECRHAYQYEVGDDYVHRNNLPPIRITNNGDGTKTLEVNGVTLIVDERSPIVLRNDNGEVFYSEDPSIPVTVPQPENTNSLRHPFTSDTTAEHWKYDPYVPSHDASGNPQIIRYVSCTREYDAWAFSGQLDSQEVFTNWVSDSYDINDLNPTYEGHWGRPWE